ncbi:unnamed protein product [Zymoseptoria tritici ST99CH_1E4]|uniref:Glycoside hydrolase family 105 protein n=1 Tax=Zymoseptoria tritici ST99CH_1E4 TaxID=1276532 RepID=A0A2H1G6A7_ZYMTR|nr:unnamed protein product [Zymoseptoria tritici ST99CH_1E4]
MKLSSKLWTFILCLGLATSEAETLHCPVDIGIKGLGGRMVDSSISRGQGNTASNGSTGFIEQGIFQQSLRESIAFYTDNSTQTAIWEAYLQNSLESAVESLSNVTAAAGLPLDRLSIGTNMIHQYLRIRDETFLPAICALSQSVVLQEQNANGGLWYYANRKNISAYQNLSYVDGMYSYPAFAILTSPDATNDTAVTRVGDRFGAAAAFKQLEILRNITQRPDGLLLHGYDAIKNHTWADPTTGASPEVWARAQAWYTIGTLEVLELLLSAGKTGDDFEAIKAMFIELVRSQIRASGKSLSITGTYGVWQVVDQPGASFNGYENFIETSSSCMTAYALLKAVRLGILQDATLASQALDTGLGMYQRVLRGPLIHNGNGTLSLNGTSSVASLSGDVSAQYYVTRPTVLNSLIGTSAFTIASLEVERIC